MPGTDKPSSIYTNPGCHFSTLHPLPASLLGPLCANVLNWLARLKQVTKVAKEQNTSPFTVFFEIKIAHLELDEDELSSSSNSFYPWRPVSLYWWKPGTRTKSLGSQKLGRGGCHPVLLIVHICSLVLLL